MSKDFIPVKEFVNQLESFSIDFYKKCFLETNQFSTKYVLQNVIKDHQQHKEQVLSTAVLLGDENVNSKPLSGIMEDFIRNNVESEFELNNLNFVEATHLAIILMEYIIDVYKKLFKCVLSEISIDSLNSIYDLKEEYLAGLKKEYEKLRYK